jgi:ribosomal protein L12E/L44/L45/RPP1/RPP2
MHLRNRNICPALQVREGCFAVDTAPFRAAIEAHAAAALAALGRTVHTSAARDRESIANFAQQSRSLLSREAASLSELGEARVLVSFSPGVLCVKHLPACTAATCSMQYSCAVRIFRMMSVLLTYFSDARPHVQVYAFTVLERFKSVVQAIDIMRQVPEMRKTLKSLEQKNVLLETMSKVAAAASAAAVASVPPPVDATDAASDWESLVASLTAHEGHLDQQKEELAKQVLLLCACNSFFPSFLRSHSFFLGQRAVTLLYALDDDGNLLNSTKHVLKDCCREGSTAGRSL